ncbi:O-antigen ligase family protein [Acrocarpospora catenulata]|uniref:O-antigen ligase family protein n=1 Tax=Acrocarpospora catenulata TaxID=2836182 RepID=UPI001BDB240D|nr:O-antigen ligase family protein [Acrocarpospora catenulata]
MTISALDTPLRQRADGASLLCVCVLVLLLTPARLVLRGLPMSLTLSDVLGLFTITMWMCAHLTTTLGIAKGPVAVRRGLFTYLLAIFFLYGYATYAYLPSDELNSADHSLVLILANLGLALGMCDMVRGRDRLDFVLKGLVVAGAGMAVVGAVQWVFGFDLTAYMQLPILSANDVAVDAVEARSGITRVPSTTGHPIEFGVIMAMLLPFALHFGLHAKDRGEPPLRWWIASGMIAVGLMFAVSRSGILAVLTVGLVLFMGWSNRRRLQALGIVAIFLAVVKVIFPGLLGAFVTLFTSIGSGRDDSIRYRVHDYPNAAAEFLRRPLFGRGIGTWYAPKHQVFDNQYLLTAVEAGTLGLIAFVGIVLVGVYGATKARYLFTDPRDQNLALTMAAATIVPLVGAITFDLLAFPQIAALMFVMIGSCGALLRIAEEDRRAAQGGPAAPRRTAAFSRAAQAAE